MVDVEAQIDRTRLELRDHFEELCREVSTLHRRTSRNALSVAHYNELLVPLGVARLEPEEWAPLAA